MAVGYLKENFAFGTLNATVLIGASQLTMAAGHSLPTASGSFQLVIWDAASFPNPSDDPDVEIVTASFDAGDVYDIVRAQEGTSAIEHAVGEKAGLHYTAAVNVDDLDALNHTMARVSGSTFSNVQHMQNIFHSAGWVSGGAVTDDGDGTITVAVGTGLIRANDTATATILYFDWAAESGANVALIDNDISYIYVEYNSGSPQVIATITERTDFNKNVLLAVVSRIGTDLHINQTDQHTVGDHANNMIRRLKGVQPYGHVSGAKLSETGTRNIAVTSGKFWRGLTEFTTSAIDTSGAPTFSYYYNSGAGWQKVASVSDIHQTNYNDFGVGLATLSNNKYGVHWVYLEADDDDIAVVYGIGNYTLSQAEDAQPPSALPQHLQMEGILAGKIIIKESEATFTQLESAFETKFVGSIATDHADLASLDFATAGHTGFQAQSAVLDDLATLGEAGSDGQMIVATGAGAFAYESGATLRTSIGVGLGDTLVTSGYIVEKDAVTAPIIISCAHDTEATTAKLTLRKSDNTIASPDLVDDNAKLGTINFDGYNGSAFITGARVEVRIAGTPSVSSMPTEYSIWTCPAGSVTALERLTISPSGMFGIGTTTNTVYILQAFASGAKAGIVATSDGSQGNFECQTYRDSSSGGYFYSKTSRGSLDTPTNSQLNDELFKFRAYGMCEGSFKIACEIRFLADGEFGTASDPTDSPGRLEFLTSPDGSSALTKALTIDSSQNSTFSGIVDTTEVYKVDGTQVVSNQATAIVDATDAASVIIQLNDLLAKCRTHGLIAAA